MCACTCCLGERAADVSKGRRTQTGSGRVMRRLQDSLKHQAATWAAANNRVAGAHSGAKWTRVCVTASNAYLHVRPNRIHADASLTSPHLRRLR